MATRFTLTVKMDNAAFHPSERMELCGILRELAGASGPLDTGSNSGNIRDSNGNTVGEWKITGKTKEGGEKP